MGRSIKCNHCGDVLVSRSRHDFVQCSCEKCFVDGGDDYLRVGGDPKDWEFVDEGCVT